MKKIEISFLVVVARVRIIVEVAIDRTGKLEDLAKPAGLVHSIKIILI